MAQLNLSSRVSSLLFDDLKYNCNFPTSSWFQAALHTASLIQIHQTAFIQLPPLQYVRGTLAAAKHFPSVHRECFHIPVSPLQHTNGHYRSR